MMKISEYNVETGEEITREATPEELADFENRQKIFAKYQADKAAEQTKREAALAKLSALGLTTDDLSVLGL